MAVQAQLGAALPLRWQRSSSAPPPPLTQPLLSVVYRPPPQHVHGRLDAHTVSQSQLACCWWRGQWVASQTCHSHQTAMHSTALRGTKHTTPPPLALTHHQVKPAGTAMLAWTRAQTKAMLGMRQLGRRQQ